MKKIFLCLNISLLALSFSAEGANFTNKTPNVCFLNLAGGFWERMLRPDDFAYIEINENTKLYISCRHLNTSMQFIPSDNLKNFTITIDGNNINVK